MNTRRKIRMYKLNKRILSALMALLLVVSLLSGLTLTASAATVDYQTAYVSDTYPNIIKNWGTRGVPATFLSPKAEEFYSDTFYAEYSQKAGSADITLVDTSALYIALYGYMKAAHTKTTSYDATRDMFQYTDCQNNGSPSNKISAFYSGDAIGPAWGTGTTWNREHVWPNSKGGEGESGANETDIMMLRPETQSNNSSRGNAAFGNSAGYYNPQSEFPKGYDVRGDIARIVLYTYVRWGKEEAEVLKNMWGTNGVIENKAVLLEWMEVDPVDTWEMGRNDSVESITGTRNVFVDYPEFAFILFGEEIPEEYNTPTNNDGETYHSVDFVQNGVVKANQQVLGGSTCTMPAFSGVLPAGYEFVGWSATEVSGATQKPVVYAPGGTVLITGESTFHAVLSVYDNTLQGLKIWTLVTDSSQLSAGKEVIIAAKDADFAMSTTQTNNNRGQAAIEKSGNTLSSWASDVQIFTLRTGAATNSYAFDTGSGYLFVWNNSNNYLRTHSTLDKAASFYISANVDGTCKVTSAAYSTSEKGNVPMQYNSSGLFACYPKATQKALSLYVGESASGGYTYTTTWESAKCEHKETTTITIDATCTTDGSITVVCATCGEEIGSMAIPAGHTRKEEVIAPTLSAGGYTRVYCGVCGEEIGQKDSTAPLTDVQSWNLTLEDNVSVNFKINVDDSITGTAKVHIAVGSDAKVYDIGSLVANDDGTYIVSTKVAAARMTEAITVKITNGTDTTEEKTYSIKTYAQTILDGNYPETTKNLVKAMLHYGAAAQNYFNYKTNDLANAGVGAVTSAAPATANIFKTVGSADGVEFYGATLVFRDRIALRYYFTVTGDISQYTFTVSGKEVTPVHKGNQYYVEIADINPQDLDTAFTVKVNDTLSVTYSPMNYVVNMHKKGTEDLQALMQALCDYHKAAVAYLAEK